MALRPVSSPLAPPCRPITRASLAAELDRKLRRDLPLPPELYIASLVRLGFAAGNATSIYNHVLEFYGAQVLGFYEPAADELVVVSDASGGVGDQMVWTHELAHAAQERRFRLASKLLAMREDSDRQRAASAIAEGEALLVMFMLEHGDQGDSRELLANAERIMELTEGALDVPEGVPEYFVRELEFPYTAGFSAILRAFRAGGWERVDALLADPPRTTAELMHPEATVTRPGVSDAELPLPPPGWEEVLTDTLGEWAVSFWLGRALPEPEAQELAAAWDGDRLRLVRQSDDHARWAMTWVVRTRSEAGRQRLQGALSRVLPGLLTELDGRPQPPSLTWSSAGRSLEVRAAWPEQKQTGSKPS